MPSKVTTQSIPHVVDVIFVYMVIGIAFDEIHSSALLSLLVCVLMLLKSQLELVRGTIETSPGRLRQVRTGTDRTPAGGVWLRRSVCVLAIGTRARKGRGYGIFVVVRRGHLNLRKSICMSSHKSRVVWSVAPPVE